MKKINLLILFAIIMSIYIIGLASSQIQFYQFKTNQENGVIRNRILLLYSKQTDIASDYVMGNDPFETYVQYNFYVKTWNIQNPSFQVDYCNLKLWDWKHLENNTVLIFEKNFTGDMPDTSDAKYFFQLYDGDQVIAQQECHFQDTNFLPLELPAEMQIIQPTHECKMCQFYEWSKVEADITKAQLIGGNTVTISSYIQKLILLNFEIIIVLFWVSLIILLFVGIGLIFIGLYWIFIYLSRIGK